MTWYASEILATCTPALLSAVKGNPHLARHAYLLRDPISYVINETQSTFLPPEEGLLVIRPVCDPATHCAEWHDSELLSWLSLSGADGEGVIQPQAFAQQLQSELIDEIAPAGFLAALRELSAKTKTNLVFFHCFMWGGDTECEYAWLFGDREVAAVVIEPGVTSTLAQVGLNGDLEIRKGDLLSEVLAYLGAPIPSPFWVAHTREFPWDDYRLST